MTSADFVKSFATNADLSQKKARDVLESLQSTIVEYIGKGGKFKVADINFEVVDTDAWTGVNPKTGETADYPASKRLKVKGAASLKRAAKGE
jgi:nucleoid DNA-binding protein